MKSPFASEIENHDLDVQGYFHFVHMFVHFTWWKYDGVLKRRVFVSIVERNNASEFVFDVGPLSLNDIQSAGHAVIPRVWILLGRMVCRNTIVSLFPIHLPDNANMMGIKICS